MHVALTYTQRSSVVPPRELKMGAGGSGGVIYKHPVCVVDTKACTYLACPHSATPQVWVWGSTHNFIAACTSTSDDLSSEEGRGKLRKRLLENPCDGILLLFPLGEREGVEALQQTWLPTIQGQFDDYQADHPVRSLFVARCPIAHSAPASDTISAPTPTQSGCFPATRHAGGHKGRSSTQHAQALDSLPPHHAAASETVSGEGYRLTKMGACSRS